MHLLTLGSVARLITFILSIAASWSFHFCSFPAASHNSLIFFKQNKTLGSPRSLFIKAYFIANNPKQRGAVHLRILAMYEAKTAKNNNFWMFWSITLLICHLFKRQQTLFWTIVSSCEKCIDIPKVASVGGGQIANLKACHFSHSQFQLCHQRSLLKCRCTFYIYGPLVKKVSFRFLKDALLSELSPRISWRCPSNVLHYNLGDNSVNRASFKNLNDTFLTNGPKM